jgi:cysteine desulfurase
MSSGRIYLDNAATTAMDDEVLAAMLSFLTEHFGNPSLSYSYGGDRGAGQGAGDRRT